MNALKHLLQSHATFLAWLLVLACLGAERAWAQDAATNDQPAVVNAVAEPDAEPNTWTVRAAQALRSGQPDAAMPWFQRLLAADPVTLVSTNGMTFRPVRQVMAELIRTLPERSLAAFRLPVEAPRMVGRSHPPTDLASCEALYRNEIPGIRNVEAGLRLAGIYLDQERFLDARGVLMDLLDECPPTRPDRPELLARLTVACARVEDMKRAAWAWAELQKAGNAGRWPGLEAELHAKTAPAAASNAWAMAYGGPLREGTSAGAGPDLAEGELLALHWGLNLGPGVIRDSRNVDEPTNLPRQLSIRRAYAVARMLEDNRRPADDIVFAGNRAWINGIGDLALIDLDLGCVIRRTQHIPDPPQDAGAGKSFTTVMAEWYVEEFRGARGRTVGPAEAWIFDSRLSRAASFNESRVYCVEDDIRASEDRRSGRVFMRPQPSGNALAAYDAATGKLLWRVGRELPLEPKAKKGNGWQANAIRFAAAPVPCAGLLLAPVEDDNGLSVVGLEAETGEHVWRTRIVGSKLSAEPRSTPMTLTVDGADVYLCGESWVSRMDGCDGSVRWTTLYEPLDTTISTNAADKETKLRNAWEEGLLLVAGDAVVALPEGSEGILAFDRRSGVPLWNRPKPEGVNYVVGRQGSALVVAGERAAVSVNLADGSEVWRAPIKGSTGRGALCGQEVLIPNGQTILRLRAADGTALKPVRAQTPDNLPLGNLYVQGEQLLVAGLERLYALTPAAPTFARLNESLARNPSAGAYAERANLYALMQRPAEAVVDLREAWKLEQKGTNRADSVRGTLLTALWRLAEKDPASADGLHAEAIQVAATAAERTEAIWRQAQCREKAGNTNGALDLYVAILSAPDATIPPVVGDADLEVSARLLAARRLDAVLAGDGARRRALLDAPAAQALARLGSQPSFTGLVEVATLFPGTPAGKEATLKAAQAATETNNLGTAEAILYRALTLSAPPDRAAAVDALLKLYERMKWVEGSTQLKAVWPQLFGEEAVPEALERAAAAASSAAGATPLPPWRLRWRKALGQGAEVRPIGAGLLYWNYTSKKAGFLMLDTGLPRWENSMKFDTGVGDAVESPGLVPIFMNNIAITYMDTWSGAIASYWPPIIGQSKWWRIPAGRASMALAGDQVLGGRLVCFDMLTGQIAWKRRELESLMNTKLQNRVPLITTRSLSFCSRRPEDDSWTFLELDFPTGAVTSRSTVQSWEWNNLLMMRKGRSDVNVERGPLLFENERLTVEDPLTGTVVWTSPPDLAIAKHYLLNNGSVFAMTSTNAFVLLNGRDGKLLRRWEGLPFDFDYASNLGDAVIAYKRVGFSLTNEVLVLDPAASNAVFRGGRRLLQGRTEPVLSLGPALPGQLIVRETRIFMETDRSSSRTFLQVIDEQGENPKGWRLPRKEDIRDESGNYQHFSEGGLILMYNKGTGEVLAYEHDPGEGAKK